MGREVRTDSAEFNAQFETEGKCSERDVSMKAHAMLRAATLLIALVCGCFAAQAKDDCNNYGQWELMIEACSRVIAKDPRAAWAFSNRSTAHERIGNYDKALADSNKAIELSPRWSDAYGSRAAILVAMKNYDEALLDLKKALDLDGNNTVAFINRGYIYEQRGDRDRAVADYRRALEIGKTPKRTFNIDFARKSLERLGAVP